MDEVCLFQEENVEADTEADVLTLQLSFPLAFLANPQSAQRSPPATHLAASRHTVSLSHRIE